jgi:hypothetical protein
MSATSLDTNVREWDHAADFRQTAARPLAARAHRWRIAQKYFINRDFGGALQPGCTTFSSPLR